MARCQRNSSAPTNGSRTYAPFHSFPALGFHPSGLLQYSAHSHVIELGGWYAARHADVFEVRPLPCTQLKPILKPLLNSTLLPKNVFMYICHPFVKAT
jgi:hypothetical protein